MRVLLYSRSFWPALGGLESVSLSLAEKIAAAGHSCVVVTETAADGVVPDRFPFEVERAPGARRRLALVRSVDLVHSNGASLALFFHAKVLRKPFLWTHAGYQMVAVDGLGWLDGQAAPLTPMASLIFHARKRGLRVAGVAALKLGIRRAAGMAVDRNVAVSRWVADRQPLPRQVVIYNPFALSAFRPVDPVAGAPRYDFLYVGRLVSEKGVRTLLRALALLNGDPTRAGTPARLLIVGDGPERPTLQELAISLGIAREVHFAGRKQGRALVEAMAQATVAAIVPSEWEEAMGGVALELLAAGLPVIVSERGGLAECVGDAAWTFPNGDHQALSAQMAAVLAGGETIRRSKAEAARRVLARFDEHALARQYLDLYAEILANRG